VENPTGRRDFLVLPVSDLQYGQTRGKKIVPMDAVCLNSIIGDITHTAMSALLPDILRIAYVQGHYQDLLFLQKVWPYQYFTAMPEPFGLNHKPEAATGDGVL